MDDKPYRDGWVERPDTGHAAPRFGAEPRFDVAYNPELAPEVRDRFSSDGRPDRTQLSVATDLLLSVIMAILILLALMFLLLGGSVSSAAVLGASALSMWVIIRSGRQSRRKTERR